MTSLKMSIDYLLNDDNLTLILNEVLLPEGSSGQYNHLITSNLPIGPIGSDFVYG